MKKMKITLRKDGTQKIEVLNAVGEECLGFTHDLEKRLGAAASERELKPEYRETEVQVERDREVER
ncbi:MAG: DUF2997 domain-containing protein [Acidobacteria bacterium]|nr:DUF2997 domain-containing protein [Acidobacteriota bacterium]